MVRASSRNRSTPVAAPAARFFRIFTATGRLRLTWIARKTSPMAPAPILACKAKSLEFSGARGSIGGGGRAGSLRDDPAPCPSEGCRFRRRRSSCPGANG